MTKTGKISERLMVGGQKKMMAQAETTGFPISNPVAAEFVGRILDGKS